MITVFTTAKPFDGNDGRNQLAAIRSWRQSKLVDDIFLMGPSDLPDALREDLGIIHFKDVPLSELGTPMLRPMYDCALQNCRSTWIGYLNADIILPPNFDEVFEKLHTLAEKKPLVVGGRVDFDWPTSADRQTLTYNQIIEIATKEGRPHPPLGTDYFFHRRTSEIQFHDFIVGRPAWDNWLIHYCISQGWQVIDITPSLQVLHPNHTYEHVKFRIGQKWDGPEADANRRFLADSHNEYFDLTDVKRVFKDGQIEEIAWHKHWLRSEKAAWRWLLTTPLRKLRHSLLRIIFAILKIPYYCLASIRFVYNAFQYLRLFIANNRPRASDLPRKVSAPKTLVICHTASMYGANRSMLLVLDMLKENGSELLVLIPDYGPLVDALRSRSIEYQVVSPMPWGYNRSKRGRLERLTIELRHCVRLERHPFVRSCDLIYSNSMSLTFGATLAALAAKPHMWHIRELPESQFRLVPDWGAWWIGRLMNKASKIIAISKYVEKNLLKTIPRVASVDVIYDPAMSRADLDKILPRERIEICRTFGVVARFEEGKKIDVAIRAFSIAAEHNDEIKLEIFGDGPRAYTQYLVDLARGSPFSDRITFHGYQSDQENIFNAIDCLIACAPHEAFGRTVAEAMLLGIPIVGVNNGGTAELLNVLEAGLLFDGTAENLAGKMLMMARDTNLYQAFSREALTRSGPLFLADSVKERFLRAFSEN